MHMKLAPSCNQNESEYKKKKIMKKIGDVML